MSNASRTPEVDAILRSPFGGDRTVLHADDFAKLATLARSLETQRDAALGRERVLREALERSANTFRDFESGFMALGKTKLADACKIAGGDASATLEKILESA